MLPVTAYGRNNVCRMHLFALVRPGHEGDALAAVRANSCVVSMCAGGSPLTVNFLVRAASGEELGLVVLKVVSDLGNSVHSIECSPIIVPEPIVLTR